MKKIQILLLTLCALSAVSCEKDQPAPEPTIAKQTVIFYCQSLNNLHEFIWNNVHEVSVVPRYNDGNNVLVFIDSEEDAKLPDLKQKNQLLLIEGNGNITPVEGFAEKFDHTKKDPSSVNTLSEIMTFCAEKFPAQKYGLIMSSHGSGWQPFTKSIGGNDFTKNEMEIDELAAKIPLKLEFILFDACLMNNIEVIYEFKDVTQYVIGSVLMIPGAGVCYDIVLPYLLNGSYGAACTRMVDFYRYQPRDVTFAATRTKDIEEFASYVKDKFSTLDCTLPKYDPNEFMIYEDTYYVDMLNFFRRYFSMSGDNFMIDKILVGKDSYFVDDSMEMKSREFSGCSLWIPNLTHSSAEDMLLRIKNYKWYKDGGADIYLDKLMKLPR